MGNAALDQFLHALQSQIVSVMLLCALGVLFIGCRFIG
jgi:hypothetical protein